MKCINRGYNGSQGRKAWIKVKSRRFKGPHRPNLDMEDLNYFNCELKGLISWILRTSRAIIFDLKGLKDQ